MTRFLEIWLLLFAVVLMPKSIEADHDSNTTALCAIKQPESCIVLPPEGLNINGSHTLELLKRTFVNSTGNKTVYVGQTATFRLQLDSSVLPGVSSTAYVDGCRDDTNCKLIRNDEIMECIFKTDNHDVTADWKKIRYYVYALLTKLCYNPPSYLHVLGPPVLLVNVSSSQGINLQIPSPIIVPDTILQYSLYYVGPDGQFLIHESYFATNGTNAVLSPLLLHNHTGIYKIMVTPISSTAGNGTSSSYTINLPTDSYSIEFTVDNVTVEVTENHQFVAQFLIKINQSSLLTVPNNFFITSSCSNDGEVDYPVNITKLLKDPDNNQILISHPLLQGKHDCNFTVRDETGQSIAVNTNQSTFHTASYQLHVTGSCVYVQCTFTPGTMAEGCMIAVYDTFNDPVLYPHTNQSSSDYYVRVGCTFDPGRYSLYIYDYINGTFNRSTADLVFERQFAIQRTSHTMILSTSQSIHTSPSGTPNCNGDECNKNPPPQSNSQYIIIGTVLSVAVVGLVLLVIILFIVAVRRHNRGIVHNQPENPADDEESGSEVGSESAATEGDQSHGQVSEASNSEDSPSEECTEGSNEESGSEEHIEVQSVESDTSATEEQENKTEKNPHEEYPMVDEAYAQPIEPKGSCAAEEQESETKILPETLSATAEGKEPVKKYAVAQLESTEAEGGTHMPMRRIEHIPRTSKQQQQVIDEETSFSNVSSDQPLLPPSDKNDEELAAPVIFNQENQEARIPFEERMSSFPLEEQDKSVTIHKRRLSLVSSNVVVVLPSQEEHQRKTSITKVQDTMAGQLLRKKSSTTLVGDGTNHGGGEMLLPSSQLSAQHTELIRPHYEEYEEKTSHKTTSTNDSRNTVVHSTSVNARPGDTSASTDVSETAMLLKT